MKNIVDFINESIDPKRTYVSFKNHMDDFWEYVEVIFGKDGEFLKDYKPSKTNEEKFYKRLFDFGIDYSEFMVAFSEMTWDLGHKLYEDIESVPHNYLYKPASLKDIEKLQIVCDIAVFFGKDLYDKVMKGPKYWDELASTCGNFDKKQYKSLMNVLNDKKFDKYLEKQLHHEEYN
jgi:hypothetical protein